MAGSVFLLLSTLNPPNHHKRGGGNTLGEKYDKPRNPSGKGGFADNPDNINRAGVSSKARLAWLRANEAAAEFAAIQLEAHLSEAQTNLDAENKQAIIEMLTPQINALIKQATDRIEGTPKQSIDLSSEDGSMSPKADHSDAVLKALQAKHGKPDA